MPYVLRTAPRHRGTSRAACALLAAACWLTATIASASDESTRVLSRGLVQFHAQHYKEALGLFDAAVKADPQDPYARYYRGVTRGRLGNFAGAASDLYEVVESRPEMTQATLELGVALVQAGRYDEGVPWLERAQKVKRLSARASFFLGIAELRRGHLAEAQRNFERAASEDASLDLSARYYQGVAAYQRGNRQAAEAQFTYVATTSPNSRMGREATTFLTEIHKGGRARLQLYGAVGMQYDSNVVLAPSDNSLLATSRQSDGRATITLGGTYVPWRTDRVELSLGYEFFQSLHIHLTDFNLQDHRPNAQISADLGVVQLGMRLRYDYYFLDTQSFLQEGVALPWLAVPEGDRGRTEVSYRLRRRDFLKQPYSSTSLSAFGVGGRDAFNHAVNIRQLGYLGSPERYLFLGYQFDREEPVNAVGDPFGYNGNEIDGGVGWAFPLEISAELSYAYRDEHYDPASARVDALLFSPAGKRRHDGDHQIFASASKPLGTRFALIAAYLGTFNDSNKPFFDYDRHIVSVELEMRFY